MQYLYRADINITASLAGKKAHELAIRLEFGFLGVALALADLHVAKGRHIDACCLTSHV